MEQCVSIAIETSCRRGGVALGLNDDLIVRSDFDASTRHATQLITRLDEMLKSRGLGPVDVGHVYVSVGPGSFTGTRIGVTVARTLAQATGTARCVAVPTPQAVAMNAEELEWENLAVILDARGGMIYARTFVRRDGRIVPADEGQVTSPGDFLSAVARPVTLIGEGLGYYDLSAADVTIPSPAETSLHLPNAEGVWRLGRRMSARGQFTDYRRLLPIYVRGDQAERIDRQGDG